MCEKIREVTGVDVLAYSDVESLRGAARSGGVACGDAPTWGRLIDDVFSDHVEPHLVQPTFITDYPLEL